MFKAADEYYHDSQNLLAHSSVPWQQAILRRFLKESGVGGICLDVGSGIGNNIPTLLTFFSEVSACDVSELALSELVCRHGSGIRITKALINSLPYASGSFDVVICTEVLEHCDDPMGALTECLRVLKRGGYLVLSTPNYCNFAGLWKMVYEVLYPDKHWDAWSNHQDGLERSVTSFQLRKWVKSLGLIIVEDTAGDLIRSWLPFLKSYYSWIDRHPMLSLGRMWPTKYFLMNYFILTRKGQLVD